ncbi:MAG TPA: 2-oxoacid:acceptor oxidoreductase subunit alpha [Candidatus Polarisedimenticolaceae bacterium]|nr:2-oxoacid:acceptor oxidoreductase subunit alpha [Candidatus Polarisedimenticolaceae bacterium]
MSPRIVDQHIVEFVSDSGEGAQTAGQMFGTVSARMGNGVWTVEIIPAEIEPPHRSQAGASGNRIRIATGEVTNMGEAADVVVAFNEQVLYSRIDVGALRPGTVIFLESAWADAPEPAVREAYAAALRDFAERGFEVVETPMERECKKIVADPRRGKNMWALGLLCAVYSRDLAIVFDELEKKLGRKGAEVVESNRRLVLSGRDWALEHVPLRYEVPVEPRTQPRVVMNGNQAVALGMMAAGIEVVAMYPITPATSVSHYLAASFHRVGGFLHQAEDEISAIGYALGASYAGKTAATVTSGPGLALKTEFLGLAVMAELPLVLVVVQRGSPSTGLPTRVEQGDLLAAVHGEPGDAPKIVMAASTIEECFQFVITARKLAETFRGPVVVLTDANLATGQTSFRLPEPHADWLSPPVDRSAWTAAVRPYEWDPTTGLSQRPVPGQRGGEYVLTGLAHDEASRVAYESAVNQRAMRMRSRKLITLQKSLRPPEPFGDPQGELLVVGWGSTRGAIEEAVSRLRARGERVSSLTLRFLSPLEPGLAEIFARFAKVMTIEINYSDDADDPEVPPAFRRRSQLARLLRSHTLVDVDCWSRVPGVPLAPNQIEEVLHDRLAASRRGAQCSG